jgi:predicted aldo/keto reductase-like oxidoreductase
MSRFSRREFLIRSSAAVAAAGVAGRYAPAVAREVPAIKIAAGTDVVTLGRSGIRSTVLGIGTGTVGGREQRDLGQDSFSRLVREAYDRGLRYIDTADAYRTHAMVGEAIKALPRGDLFIQTKTRAKQPEAAKADIERFRRELGVETLDVVLMHCMQRKGWVAEMRPVIDVLQEAKRQGQVRAIGVSCHGLDPLVDSVDCGDLDIHLVRINHQGEKMDGTPEEVSANIHKIYQQGRGVIGMKIYGEGAFKSREDRLASLKYVLGLGAVHCFTIGFNSAQQIDETLALIKEAVA